MASLSSLADRCFCRLRYLAPIMALSMLSIGHSVADSLTTRVSGAGLATVILGAENDVLRATFSGSLLHLAHNGVALDPLGGVRGLTIKDKGGTNSLFVEECEIATDLLIQTSGAEDQFISINNCVIADDLTIRLGRGNDNILIESVTVADDTNITTADGNNLVDLFGVSIGDRFRLVQGRGNDLFNLAGSTLEPASLGGLTIINSGVGEDVVMFDRVVAERHVKILTGKHSDKIDLASSRFKDRLTVNTSSHDDVLQLSGNTFDNVTVLDGSAGRSDRYINDGNQGVGRVIVRGFERAGPPKEPRTLVDLDSTVDRTILADASRFLQMASLAATPKDINLVVANGPEAWLDNELAKTMFGSRWDWLVGRGNANSRGLGVVAYFNYASWQRLFTAQNPVQQRWALALSEIFVINPNFQKGAGGWEGFGGAAYLDRLERMGTGSYRELLEEITLSHQMGAYLSILWSRKSDGVSAPDENYAREVLQLFSIGLHELHNDGTLKLNELGKPIETYTSEDIQGLAKVFTGWRRRYRGTKVNAVPIIIDSV